MKKILSVIIAVAVITACLTPFSAAAFDINGFKVTSKAALLISLDTGEVMFEKNADKKAYPASLTKIMTACVVLDKCENLDTEITVDGYCIDILSGTGLTVGNLVDGERISVRTLLNLMMVCSSADAANVLADYIGGGDIDAFVGMMNDKAKKLGMKNTAYTNVHGLHDDNHYTTPVDMAKLCEYTISLPVFMDVCSQSRYTVPETNKHSERIISTTNLMIDNTTSRYYKYAKGIKTGYTTPAGRCLCSTANREGYNYLCIVMGGDDSTRSEFTDSKNLYEWAFDSFEYKVIATPQTIVGEIPVELSWDTDFIQLFPEKNVSGIIPKEIVVNSDNETGIEKVVVLRESSVWAPVKKGDIMGYVSFRIAQKEIAKVNIVANENVDRNILLYILKIAEITVSSKWFLLIASVFVLLLVILIVANIIHNKRKRRNKKKVKHIRKF